MSCVRTAKISGEFLLLDCGRKIRIYCVRNGNVAINPLLSELWIDLFWTEPFMDQSNRTEKVNPSYSLPSVSATLLKSTKRDPYGACIWDIGANGTDPEDVVSNLNGPVSDASNSVINTAVEEVNYRFRWNLSSPSSIGFYSEIVDNQTKVAPMLDIHGNITLFDCKKLTGEFTTFDYREIVVITNKPVEVELYVEVVIPNVPYTYEVPSTKYIYFTYFNRCTKESTKYRFPAYKLIPSIPAVIVDVNPKLLTLEKLVKKTILNLSVKIPPPNVGKLLERNVTSTIFPNTSRGTYEGDVVYTATYRFGKDIWCVYKPYNLFDDRYMSPMIFRGSKYTNRFIDYEVTIGKEYFPYMLNREFTFAISVCRQPLTYTYVYERTETYQGNPIKIAGIYELGKDTTAILEVYISYPVPEDDKGFVEFGGVTYGADEV